MSLISRVSRLSYGNRIIHRTSLTSQQTLKPQTFIRPQLLISRSFAGHGPPTKLGFPHAWGSMVWFPSRALLWFSVFINLQLLGMITWYKWDSIPYPVHRYNDENTTARNY